MASSTSKPAGRTLAEFSPLKPAEQTLLDTCRKGESARISEQRPEQATDRNTVRASFLRFLALGGDDLNPLHEKGAQLWGAWIDGELDLAGTTLPHSLVLVKCYFNITPVLHDSDIHGFLSFEGCYVKGLAADRMICNGSVFLKDGFTSTGTVRLLGAQIDGDLECGGSELDGNGNDALTCERSVIKGSVFLKNSTATATVRLLATQIGGSLECHGASLQDTRSGQQHVGALVCDRVVIRGGVFLKDSFTATGTVRLMGAQIGGNLECIGATLEGVNGDALAAEYMTVAAIFFLRDLQSIKGNVNLTSAKVGSLVDDATSWSGELILDGFVYDKLIGKAPTDAESRLAWLKKQPVSHMGQTKDGKDFKPQPWRQLQKVLHDMGHVEDARQVAIAFEVQLRKANLIGQTPISRGLHWLFGALIGYGYRPLRLFFIMLFVWLGCGVFYWYAAYDGVFAPSNPLVFQNPNYTVCVPDSDMAKAELAKSASAVPPPVQGAGNWYLCAELREEYTGFSPLAYSLDVILPLVDLQQERDWAPMIPTPKSTWTDELFTWSFPKHCIRFLMWFEILFGWMASLLLVAVVSGLTKRREE